MIVASPKSNTLRHLAVDLAGSISLDEVIRPEVKSGSLDAAFDATGRLHVLAGRRHFVRDSQGHWSEAPTPWSAAGLETAAPRFVHGASSEHPLLYAFDIRGKAVDAPARWDVHGLGGSFGVGIIWPWRTRGSRLAVVAEDGGTYDQWSVIDLDDNEDVADWTAVAEPDGRVHVLYDARRTALAEMLRARHAVVEPPAPDDAAQFREISGHRVRPVPGSEIPVPPERPSIRPSAAAGFSPITGELLLVQEHVGGRTLRDGAWGAEMPFPLELAWQPRVATRAAQHFDVLVTGSRPDSRRDSNRPLFYLQFRAGRWSEPVEVADASVDTLFGWIWDAVQIASDGHGHVLVTWPARDGIEARWLHMKAE